MTVWYTPDLAYIHDQGFKDYALKSAPGILEILNHRQISAGLVVDLGCGSGLSAAVLHQAGYQVLGIDISEAMIEIAKTRAPAAEFRVESLFTADIPHCAAVISIGECLNYLFDQNAHQRLESLFQRIYDALSPGGVFIFDGVKPGQVSSDEVVKSFMEGPDWIVLVEKQEQRSPPLLTRRIITLRQVGDLYRRTEEIHRQCLFNSAEVIETLTQIGFQVETMDHYGSFKLPPARVAFIAQKPQN
ncbi:MAG: class I SAM-dependent methyltransferase [Leptolyngbyaceae cyanobacterium MO_188.B28]|nr:class I SAM-dependent methyltransferase [Leptolyngbyaceae cyanobacterium MO_188.B28]